MSQPVHERLRELEAEVQQLPVRPAAAIRARGRTRGRRQLAAWTTAGVVVTATAGTALAWPHHRDATPLVYGGAPAPAVRCVLTLPNDPSAVRIRVLDGGAPAGLRDSVAAQLDNRKFTVQVGTTDPEPAAGAAALRYGPAAIGAATVVRAMLHGTVTMTFDPDRRDDTIDLAVGPAFTRFGTPTEINKNLARAGEPSAPPQCAGR
jgi:hypothetical protein